jgi:hypothetical protein
MANLIAAASNSCLIELKDATEDSFRARLHHYCYEPNFRYVSRDYHSGRIAGLVLRDVLGGNTNIRENRLYFEVDNGTEASTIMD